MAWKRDYSFKNEKMRALRARAWMRQKDMAEKMELTASQISRIEHGHNTPQMNTVMRIAKALDVNPEELVEWQDPLDDLD